GTLDGANVEILESVSEENFFLFGLKTPEVYELRNHYNPVAIIQNSPDLTQVMEKLETGYFNKKEPDIFNDIINSLKSPHDPWMTLADFESYIQAQHQVAVAYQNQERWTKMSIINSARSGRFSTDRTMREYNDDIWKLKPIEPIQ
ncbi:glycogen/starch/alpha-glucan phosphorylase, partial [Francisellaceae bacterium]|nr:glycogen/starch/alpha-glucan phosphorylase [Francisellaceae bacterium]